MSRIKIKNFGPIKNGREDNEGWIDIQKVTVFIGDQASGKSTVAKLISTFMWMEKALLNGTLPQSEVNTETFISNRCGYFRLQKYFKPETEILFEGDYCDFKYLNQSISVEYKKPDGLYFIPKIMYLPAERSFLSSVEDADSVSGLPLPLFEFMYENNRSLKELNSELPIPFGKYKLRYDALTRISYIRGEDYELELKDASSGLHSAVPMYVVSRNLALDIALDKTDLSISKLNYKQEQQRKAELRNIMIDDILSDDVKNETFNAKKAIIESKYKNSIFINIVEEPEQNLFPTSQKEILYSLLGFNNMSPGNKLIMTSHSPYLINYLTLAVQGAHLFELMQSKDNVPEELFHRLEQIIPKESMIEGSTIMVYQLADGEIKLLPSPHGFPSSKNYLNLSIAEGNYLFDQMLEIEQELS
jgi:predicted ATPase